MADNGDSDAQMLQLGGYIKSRRQAADLSLRQLADLTQVSDAYLSQIERGLHQPALRVLRSIAEALNLSPGVLLAQAGLTDTTPREPAARARTEAERYSGTEAAIRADPALTAGEQEALIQVYRGFIQDRA